MTRRMFALPRAMFVGRACHALVLNESGGVSILLWLLCAEYVKHSGWQNYVRVIRVMSATTSGRSAPRS